MARLSFFCDNSCKVYTYNLLFEQYIMVRLIATLGKTVGGPIETFENLINANYISAFPSHKVDIDEVIVITTKETEETFYVLKSVFLCCANFTKVREVALPFDDIAVPEDFVTVREKVREVLRAGHYLDTQKKEQLPF